MAHEPILIVDDHPLNLKLARVVLTSYAMRGDQERALAAGCQGYLSKPIDTRTLGKTVGRYLEGLPV